MRFLILLVLMLSSLASFSQDEETPSNEEAPESNENIAENPKGSETTSGVSKVIRHVPNPNKWRIGDVSRYLDNYARQTEVQSFTAQDLAVSGLYLPENTGKPQGGVLILHDNAQHAHWPQTVAPLREYLPDYGWNTLSLFMDQGVNRPLPKRIKAMPAATKDETQPDDPTADPADVNDTATTDETELPEDELADETSQPEDPLEDDAAAPPSDELDAIAEEIGELPDLAAKSASQSDEKEEAEQDPGEAFMTLSIDRVRAGVQQLNSLGQFNLVIIAHGSNANWAAAVLNEVYQSNPDAKGFALILVDALTSDFPTYPLNTMLANLDIAMLDLVTSHDPLDLRHAIDRRNTMRRNQRENYIQIRIPAVRTPLTGKHNGLTRRVRGWLQTNAAGEEVSVN